MRHLMILALSFWAAAGAAHADAIDDYVRGQIERHRIPGMAIAVVRGGEVVKTGAYGLAVVEHRVPVTTDTVFQLDSTNKLFTAVAVAILERGGKLRFDDPLARFLSGVPAAWSGVTVRHLLTHSSGIKDEYAEQFHGSGLIEYQTADLVAHALAQPLLHQPGETSEYNNLGFFLLTQVVERASGMPYRRFMEERVLTPAGMTQSSYAEPAAIVANLASPYAMRDGELVHMRDYMVSHAGESYALKSTVSDLARFHIALESGRLIDDAALKRMRERPRLLDGSLGAYGMAWEEGLQRGWPTYGKGGRAGATYIAFPAQRLAAIVLANLDDETGRVSYQAIGRAIAGLVEPALASAEQLPATGDPHEEGAAFLNLLRSITAGNAQSKLVNARWTRTLPPAMLKAVANHLATVKSVVPVVCDEVHVPGWESFGMVVARTCAYRFLGPEPETLRAQWAPDGTLVSVGEE